MIDFAYSLDIARSLFDPSEHVVFREFFNSGCRRGEERLMLAVLQDAIECFQQYVLSEQPWEKKLFQEAENWILSKDSDWAFSFENICDALQFDPGYIRKGLVVWKKNQILLRSAGVSTGLSVDKSYRDGKGD